jgi:tetratricopeptide (TPR) repeat protein
MKELVLLLLTAAALAGSEPAACQAGLDQARAGDNRIAQGFLWACVESGLGSVTHTIYLALTYRELKNYDSGMGQVNDLLKQRPDSVELLYLAAFLHYRRGENKDSMLSLSRAYKLAPGDWRIHQLFALNYISFGMNEAVEAELKEAIALNPTDAELQYQLGRLYFTLNAFDKSVEAMQHALAIAPEYPEVYDSLGLTYEARQNEKQAAECYRKAIELDRKHGIKDAWPLVDYAKLLFYLESPRESLPLLQQALEIDPHLPEANYQMGRVMRALNRNAEAETYFQNTVDADPSFQYAYYQLGTLAQKRGDTTRASLLMDRFKVLSDKSKASTP